MAVSLYSSLAPQSITICLEKINISSDNKTDEIIPILRVKEKISSTASPSPLPMARPRSIQEPPEKRMEKATMILFKGIT